ncbi:uncharacterized protein LOC123439929 [Hordeum vulgare subsp. vulgare]|uniref:uncharacterized protein LOC123439929 n=1 Tax=Hordeum vulgare subsp. vulgare TaxID=112509 RepID=UPI001D1A579D|nr:uncharacterized protein LOC123439929 [Hordeum vulgare subsp. vulgare]
MHSPVPNMDQLDVGRESEGGSVDNDYGEDIEGSKDDSEESEEENQSPLRPESRSKHRHDLATTPSKTLVSSTRNVKHDRAATTESAEKTAKQLKTNAPKPRKALPRMRIVVPVASTAATSVMSPLEDEEPMDVDTANMATSQRVIEVIHLKDDEELRRSTAEFAKTMPEMLVLSAPPADSIVVTTTPPASSIVVTKMPTAPLPVTHVTSAAMPTPSMLAYPMHRVPKDHTGAAKEAMIHAEHMMLLIRLQRIYFS